MSTKMDEEGNVAMIVPSKKPSISALNSNSKSKIRKYPDTNAKEANAKPKPLKNEKRSQSSSKFWYRVGDLLMMMLVLFPLSIAFWRGVWQLMDYYSALWEVDPWLSIGIGYMIPFVLYLFQEPLKKHVAPGRMNLVLFYTVSRSLLLIHSFGSVNQWRGLWKLLDDETGLEPNSSLPTLVIGIFFNLICKTFCNVLAPPLFCCVDEAATVHDCPLRFKTKATKKCQYFWDCAFSVCITASLTVCCWRGLWNLADYYLYPDDPVMSAMASLAFGYTVCIILCATQPFISAFVSNLKGLVRLTIMDMTYMIGFVGCVFAWRGVWNSYNLFLTFETETTSEWVTTIVSIIGTVLLGCVSTVVVRGVSIDGDVDKDDEWLIPYFSHWGNRVYDNIPFQEPHSIQMRLTQINV